jgi:hypothetical protein
MSRRSCLIPLGIALLAMPPSGSAGDKKPAGDVTELRVRLRLNAIEREILLDQYAAGIKREWGLRDSIRSLVKNQDERLAEYQRHQQEARDDLEALKKRLIALEVEKAELAEQLGPKIVAEEAAAAGRPSTRLKMLERRVQALEQQR